MFVPTFLNKLFSKVCIVDNNNVALLSETPVTPVIGAYDELAPFGGVSIKLRVPNKFALNMGPFKTTGEIYEAIISTSLNNYRIGNRHLTVSRDQIRRQLNFMLTFNGKPLSRRDIDVRDYGMKDGDTIVYQTMYGLGGSNVVSLPTYDVISEIERQIQLEDVRLNLQSLDLGAISSIFSSIDLTQVFPGAECEFIVKLLEDIGILCYHLIRSRSKSDYIMAIANFVKLQNYDKPFFCSETLAELKEFFFTCFDTFTLQSDDIFADMREYLDLYTKVKESPIFQKLYKFMMYVLSTGIFEKFGITFSKLGYSSFEEAAMKKKFWMGPDFIHCMLDTVLFVIQNGVQAMKLGDFSSFFHSGDSYVKWLEDYTSLKEKSIYLPNPKAFGFDRFSFLADLRDAIDRGDAIAKNAVNLTEAEARLIKSRLAELKFILATETTKRAAQRDRFAPFSILLHGRSSIGKSTLTTMLFYQYAKVHGLNCDSEFRYTRNPAEDHWNGFNSCQWCVVLDDVAFRKPDATTDGDSSVMEVIQIVNNTAFVPQQADLADKGRTPMLAELVIGSTNQITMNAEHYYATPLAVRRRFPYVVTATPKLEYTKDMCMLDSNKIEMVDGEWPNYWNWTVERIVPARQNKDHAFTEEVKKFDDVNKFLQWFALVSLEHKRVQQVVEESTKVMKNITICDKCFLNVTRCECEADMQVQAWDATWYKKSFMHTTFFAFRKCLPEAADDLMQLIARNSWAREEVMKNYADYCGGNNTFIASVGRHLPLLEGEEPKTLSQIFYDMGQKAYYKLGGSAFFLKVAGLILSYFATKKAMKHFFTSADNIVDELNDMNLQVKSSEIGSRPEGNDEKVNPWVRNEFELTKFDISDKSCSWNSMSMDMIAEKVLRNSVYLYINYIADDNQIHIGGVRATAVTGQIYVTNNHAMKDNILFMEVITTPMVQGVTSNVRIMVDESMLYRVPEKDLCFINIRGLPPKADLSGLLAKPSFKGGIFNACYLGRAQDGGVYANALSAVKYDTSPAIPELNDIQIKGWYGSVKQETVLGDCGSAMIQFTSMGPVWSGIHFLGGPGVAMSTSLTIDDFKSCLSKFGEQQVVAGVPMLSAPSAERVVGELHHKSEVRFIQEEGVANVYGSFTGFKNQPKSKVGPTIIRDAIVKRGYEVKYDAPVMKGWEPWRIALKDLVKVRPMLKPSVIAECVDVMSKDLINILPKDALSELMVYDDVTTLNGAPGVRFVDKMNRATSAGNPWKKSKKYFLECDPTDEMPEAVKLNDEIMERVDKIINTYREGRRVMPNFCAHLKDEAKSFSKIAEKKTRVFCGAPVDWSFVVRKYLLSFVRLVQNNKFAFEAAPGTNPMSHEWGDFYRFLTKHGEDRMVAGDYKAFDKNMPPEIIMAAFDVIINLYKAAGASDETLLVIRGIAADTCYSLNDFNGTLIEFFGSNPSGWPLTVILNCLVNSLYLRYVYAIRSPDGSCKNFRRDVALMTYGDDNIMGVSTKAPFFNHTAIVDVLGEAGIGYTMADKESVSVPYINISECSFLKRTWEWNAEAGDYFCPLDEESIEKSLTTAVASKTLCPEAQAVEIMSSACREYFFYGRAIFEEKKAMLKEVVEECDLQLYVKESTFPEWEELIQNYN